MRSRNTYTDNALVYFKVGVYGSFMTQGIQGTPANNSADMYLSPDKAACEAKHMAAYGNAGKDGAASEVSEATFFNKYWYLRTLHGMHSPAAFWCCSSLLHTFLN